MLSSRFVALSETQFASLELYRGLLRSGTGKSRGAKVVANAHGVQQGLALQGGRIWRLVNGGFAEAERAPVGAVAVRDPAEIGTALYSALLAPFEAQLAHITHLVISPDAELSFLPFETLSRSGSPILNRFDISYIQSYAVFRELADRADARKKSERRLLTFADPDYAVPAGQKWPVRSLPAALAKTQWQPLPGTRRESDDLARIIAKSSQRLGANASRRNLMRLQLSGDLKKYQILHFATHGYVDDDRSALVLAMSDGVDQAYLQDVDVLDLDIDSDLVLLSACDTGIGRNVRGEGIMGLPYAFLLAGNSNTLMSLWPVDDRGTAAFMSSFMKKVAGGGELLAALNDTKREFSAGIHGKQFADPRVWAAFVQYGVPLKLPAP